MLNSCRVSIFFDILIANISWKVAQTPISHITSCKSVMRTFRYIYVNCFNRLSFLCLGQHKIAKNALFWTIKGSSLRKETWKLDKWPYVFHLIFLLWLLVSSISKFENGQNSFSCGPPFFASSIFGKSSRFWQPTILFFKEETLRLLKIHIMFCPARKAKKGIRSWIIYYI